MIFQKKVTLYIDDASIRLLETQGRQIKKWAELPLEPGLVKGAVIVKETEVAARIRQLLKAQRVKTKKVVLGISGLHSISRPVTLPNLPKSMLPEAVIREARRALPIPLDQLYLSWQTISLPDGKLQLFLVAVPRKTADTLVKTLHEAGLEASQLALKPLALSRAIEEKRAILLDVQPTEFDILILCDRVAHPIRTLSLPAETLTWKEKLSLIISDVDRTIKFFDTNNKDNPLDSGVPVYVSGELINMPELQRTISESLGRPVVALSPPLEIPSQLDRSRFMTSINLALNEPKRGEWSPASFINVLPAPYQPKPISITRVVVAPGTALVVFLVVPLMMLTQTTSNNSAYVSDELRSINRMISQRQQESKELKKAIAELEKSITTAKASSTTLNSAITSISKRQGEINGNLTLATGMVSDKISLSSVSQSGNTLTVNGKAATDSDALLYASSLSRSGRFSETVVANMKRATDEQVDFILIFKSKG